MTLQTNRPNLAHIQNLKWFNGELQIYGNGHAQIKNKRENWNQILTSTNCLSCTIAIMYPRLIVRVLKASKNSQFQAIEGNLVKGNRLTFDIEWKFKKFSNILTILIMAKWRQIVNIIWVAIMIHKNEILRKNNNNLQPRYILNIFLCIQEGIWK